MAGKDPRPSQGSGFRKLPLIALSERPPLQIRDGRIPVHSHQKIGFSKKCVYMMDNTKIH
jgi:hypothetical protein